MGRAIRKAVGVSHGLPIDGFAHDFRFYEDGELRGWFDQVLHM
jgi:hypothetical protein